jgi:hypothetical protein
MLQKASNARMRSAVMIGQGTYEKRPENPSCPYALSTGREQIMPRTSSSGNLSPNSDKFRHRWSSKSRLIELDQCAALVVKRVDEFLTIGMDMEESCGGITLTMLEQSGLLSCNARYRDERPRDFSLSCCRSSSWAASCGWSCAISS